MNFWDSITGNDLTREHKAFETRAAALPADRRVVWEEVKTHLSPHGSLLYGIVDFFEEGVAAGKGVLELIGVDVATFCDDLVDSRGLGITG
ncbi:DUF1048 domain-containing protein [Umezawaea sp. Da 62-37]|uniref:DUF1048 domain-containing protein n=1 Tax=Umezawaea sp. Da 62-37 TaxID=3075927 RepID=UPI0028F6CD55|nr:DUF1048 domain-containing protein [Umezawaea sp. Da 62-37]WNV86985.1 DUF1048 domain-containing protein [Umezawaea sp. Da 62-37]